MNLTSKFNDSDSGRKMGNRVIRQDIVRAREKAESVHGQLYEFRIVSFVYDYERVELNF